jgi:hypothetical protein
MTAQAVKTQQDVERPSRAHGLIVLAGVHGMAVGALSLHLGIGPPGHHQYSQSEGSKKERVTFSHWSQIHFIPPLLFFQVH